LALDRVRQLLVNQQMGKGQGSIIMVALYKNAAITVVRWFRLGRG